MTGLAEHIHAIQAAKARYCAAADQCTHDPEGARAALEAVFTPDVVGDYGFDPMNGADAIAGFLSSAIAANSEWMLHMIHSPLVEVRGAEATGDWTVMVHSKRRETGAVDVIIGRYSDEFRLTDAGWRIVRIRFSRLT